MSKKEKVADEKSDEVSPTKINKYDPYSLKDAIDQQIISVLSLAHLPQALEKKGFSESHKYINIKILLAFIGVSFGVASHFYPIPFPQNIPLLILCIVGYVLLAHALKPSNTCSSSHCAASYGVVSFLYYVLEGYYEKEAFYVASDHNVGSLLDTADPRSCTCR